MICPAKDGSVSVSWYPVMPVEKQISPSARSVLCAPNPRPHIMVPSARIRAAVAALGLSAGAIGFDVLIMGSGRSDSVSGCRSDNDRPVARSTVVQCLGGMARACRHLRMASVLTPVRRAACSAPPRRSIILSIVIGIG